MSRWLDPLRTRRRFHEKMDAADVEPALLRKSLDFIEKINVRLGYTAATLRHLDELTRSVPHDRPVRILDVATGGADVPRAILEWSGKNERGASITALDFHELTLQEARRRSACVAADPRRTIGFIRGDARQLPFDDNAFDIAASSMFLHHLDESDAIDVLKELNRVARHAVLVADLLRSARAYAWITLFTLLANPIVRHDARVSVKQAFREAEIIDLAHAAGLRDARIHRHFAHRFVLTSRK